MEGQMPTMRVDLYSMVNGYGFCDPVEDDPSHGRVYFRVEDFVRLSVDEPLPIAGELVEVVEVLSGGKSPRAASVQRLKPPQQMQGTVKSFDAAKGWGFIERGSETYFLHRSDLVVAFTPVIGSTVGFYAGTKKGRPRACYVSRVG
jgi:cold shock CspA family protein